MPNSKNAVVLLAEGFEEIEAIAVIDILRRSGVNVTVAGLGGLAIKSARGLQVSADKQLEQVAEEFDACVLPGGAGAERLAASEKVRSMVLNMHRSGKLVAAICASPAVVLAPTGILNNKSATGYPGTEDSFDPSTKYKNEKVVMDGNIITSAGPGTAMDFALAVAEQLSGKEVSTKVRKAVLLG